MIPAFWENVLSQTVWFYLFMWTALNLSIMWKSLLDFCMGLFAFSSYENIKVFLCFSENINIKTGHIMIIRLVQSLQLQVVLSGPEDSKADLKRIEELLKQDKTITNVNIVHCETSTGVIHPVVAVGKLVKEHAPNASFFVDAMSSFGAVPLNLDLANIDFMVSSANKCLEGVPGFSFVIGHIDSLMRCKGWARSMSLDIVDQFERLENTGQIRFTPATHTMLAFRRALSEFKSEGGVVGRAERSVR